ncbi:MAG: hypothetical protein IAF02_04120 [Anaerolineae bacterium]|nr:hypothetical protein [Anaerolineae bacterium]
MQPQEVRRRFVSFYQKRGFQLLPPAPMIHPSIPMSFVMSAGLVQVETSLAQAEQKLVDKCVLVQQCFRHFDLDRVGQDDVHLSLFEMPGAFQFNPRDKQQTIRRMWQLATEVLEIEPNKLWVTYFMGGEVAQNVQPIDEETYQTWLDVGVEPERIIGLDADHNYWVQSDKLQVAEDETAIRKAGPNTELFFDHGEQYGCSPACRPGCRCGRFVEFANSLFISFQIDPVSQEFSPLSDPFFETVIGIERVTMIKQGVHSVFDTADYRSIIDAITPYITNSYMSPWLRTTSVRIIVDHLRALYMLVADGAPPPGKNGRERIIRLLIRNTLTRKMLLGIKEKEFLHVILYKVAETFYVQNEASKIMVPANVKKTLKYFEYETEKYAKTLDRGLRKLDSLLKNNTENTLSGNQIVMLEKQLGVPSILVERTLNQKGIVFDTDDYDSALTEWTQKHKSSDHAMTPIGYSI